MCGITGFVSQKFNIEHLYKMTRSIKHRGPDTEGYFYDESSSIGLGHRRLSILDLSEHANQPMTSHCERYVIVFNGEVYNYKEIAKNIERTWRTTSDTEIILEAFVEYGEDFVHHLNGMFAIAILDKTENKLYLFRDRFGIKPLLYFFDGKTFAFASELKALLSLNLPKILNKKAIKDYLFLEYIPQEQTVFNHYFKLKPGHYLILKKGRETEIKQYYDIIDKLKPNTSISEEEAIAKLKEKLAQSIDLRKISDVPIGSFLSGGTDSSLICSIFQEINSVPIETFNIGFDITQYDESGFAKRVSEVLKTNHHYQLVNDAEAKKHIEFIVDYYDEPFAVPSVIPTSILSKKTKEHVTVAFSGDGGDELFMGYGYYNWHTRIEKLKKLGGKSAVKLASILLSTLNNKNKRAARVMDIPDFENNWMHIWSQEQYMFTEKEITQLFNEPYKHTSTFQNWQKIDALPIHPFEKISLFDIQNYLSNDLLHKIDIASMSSGLEVRVPMLDHNFVEFAINLPMNLKIKDGEQKYLLKKLLSSYLPKELVYRQKWGFPAPIGYWLKTDLSYLIDDYLNKEIVEQIGLFNFNYIEKLVHEFKSGSDFHYKRLWALIYFNMWYNRWYISKIE
ncbi:asparagine synthase (glutamine-hydrolyzing) [Vicingus serpentipes]|uniref:asparagine synthase (glutamine-hydrolyzing) n=1 Tax=Vicingus serpentipes TaxID=1926625 RepID=A0A5C6RYZ0_9FLAO|nr:asparagine synthase (glutamine-hydrolyzing) [Vicingus serpentipes]TXB67277.1 asparagine synthase (glutamine-hydrolyzing) [Vicingus serpentipes]